MRPALTQRDFRAYLRSMADTSLHRMDFRLLTLDFAHITSIRPIALEGVLNYQPPTANVDRTMTASFLDPHSRLGVDRWLATDGLGGFNRIIQARHSVWVPDLTAGAGWVTVPCFTGIPGTVTSDGEQITMECQDLWVRDNHYVSVGYIPKGTPVVDAFRILARLGGMTKFAIPTSRQWKVKLSRRLAYGGPDEARQPGALMRKLARAHDWRIYRDGAGVLRVTTWAQSPTMIWRQDGVYANVLDLPDFSTDHTTMRNVIVARGRKRVPGRKGKNGKVQKRTAPVSARSALPASHAYSMQSLAAGGRVWEQKEWIDVPDVTTQKQINALAKRTRIQRGTQIADAKFDVMPVYHMEPSDPWVAQLRDGDVRGRLREAQVPLLANDDEAMNVGYQDRFRAPRRSPGRRRR